MDRDIAPLSRNVLASFLANRAGVPVENLRRIPLNARSKLANFTHLLRATSLSRPRDDAASKFENRINYVHDVAVVRHDNESAAPVPACAA